MPAKPDATPALPGLSPVRGRSLVARFDGGRLCGTLALRKIELRLGIAERLPLTPLMTAVPCAPF